MSITQPPIADTQWDPVTVAEVSPTVDQVALLERTRTVDETGTEQGTFTATTRPTATEAQNVIAQAAEAILSRVPVSISPAFYERITHAIALYSAIIIEGSFYREQLNQGSVQLYMSLLNTIVQAIADVAGGPRQGRRVDSIVMRGTQAEYQPYYPLPPPRQIVELPSTS